MRRRASSVSVAPCRYLSTSYARGWEQACMHACPCLHAHACVRGEQVFISKANLADEQNKLKWCGDATPTCWMSEDETTKIDENSWLRLKLLGVR